MTSVMNIPSLFFRRCTLCVAAFLAVVCCMSCGEDRSALPTDDVRDGLPVRATLSVRVGIGRADAARSRADEPLRIPGTEDESRIRTLTLFVVPLLQDGSEDHANTQSVTTYPEENDEGSFKFTINTVSGAKHIYLGANLTGPQRMRFAAGEECYEVPADDHDVSELASAEHGFAMFGQGKTTDDDSGRIVIGSENGNETHQLRADLERAAVKVLLVMKTTDGDNREDAAGDYLPVANTGGMNDKVWMRFSDVQYVLNNINRYPYFLPHTKTETIDGQTVDVGYDRNFRFEDVVAYDAYGYPYYLADKDKEFITEGRYHTPVRQNLDGIYTEGIYCTENFASTMFDDNMTGNELVRQMSLRHMLTYMRICVKVIPRSVLTEANITARNVDGVSFQTPDEALKKLCDEAAGDGDDAPYRDFPKETLYFYPPTGKFLTYKAFRWAIGKSPSVLGSIETEGQLSPKDFSIYKDGREYYTTFIDGKIDNGKILYSHMSGLRRNHYYILTVNSLSFPNQSAEDIKNIEFDIQRYDWTAAGRGELILEK